ncbi:hypothetical protein FGO68_gene6958 [Halteria grandinella]|uniref:Uncharacterized protein n=1 Tax=Halteria grandinella TaxID=5974 RepID=A0A8J8P050_HALGN|nr:hypothetical protein FGO68_gene6958 [Halteria grandinella]
MIKVLKIYEGIQEGVQEGEDAEMKDEAATNASPDIVPPGLKQARELASILMNLQQTFTVILPLLDSAQQIDQRTLGEILSQCAEKTEQRVREILSAQEARQEDLQLIALIQKELESIMDKFKARALREIRGRKNDEDSKIDQQ